MNARVSSHVGSRPAASHLVERRRLAVPVRQDRLAVDSGPGDVQRRIQRVDGVLAVRGCRAPSTGTSPSNHLPAQGKRGPGPRRGRSTGGRGRRAPPHPSCPNVGEPTRMSTTTSNTEPRRHVDVLGLARRQLREVQRRAAPRPPTPSSWPDADRTGVRRTAVNAGIGEPFEEHAPRIGVQLRGDLPRAGHGELADLHWPRSA